MRALACIVGVLISVAVSPTCRAMEFSILDDTSSSKIIVGLGEVVPGDDRKLHEFVAALPGNATLLAIMLSSPGGNYVEGVNLATTVKNTGIKTAVAPNGLCASACFLMFAAGTDKIVFENARVGVHSASNASGLESTTSQAVTTLMARKAAELGVPPAIIGKMVTTPASQIA